MLNAALLNANPLDFSGPWTHVGAWLVMKSEQSISLVFFCKQEGIFCPFLLYSEWDNENILLLRGRLFLFSFMDYCVFGDSPIKMSRNKHNNTLTCNILEEFS